MCVVAHLPCPSNQARDDGGQPCTHICHMPTGWQFHFTLPISKAVFDALAPSSVYTLKSYLNQYLATLSYDDQPQIFRYVVLLIYAIECRLARFSKEQHDLWIKRTGFPVWDEEEHPVEFFVDHEGLERVGRVSRSEDTRKTMMEYEKREAHAKPNSDCNDHASKTEKPGIVEKKKAAPNFGDDDFHCDGPSVRLIAHMKNTSLRYENTYFPDCEGSFKNEKKFEAYKAALKKYERMLIAEGLLRVIDRPPGHWELVEGPAIEESQSFDELSRLLDELLNEADNATGREPTCLQYSNKFPQIHSPPYSQAWSDITSQVQVSQPDWPISELSPGLDSNEDTGMRLKFFGTTIHNTEEQNQLYQTLPKDQRGHLSDHTLGGELINGEHVTTPTAHEASMRFKKALANLEKQSYHNRPPAPFQTHEASFPDGEEWLEQRHKLTAFEFNLIEDGMLQIRRLQDGSVLFHDAPDAVPKGPHAIERAMMLEREFQRCEWPSQIQGGEETFHPEDTRDKEWVDRMYSPCLEEVREDARAQLTKEFGLQETENRASISPQVTHAKPLRPTVESESSSQVSTQPARSTPSGFHTVQEPSCLEPVYLHCNSTTNSAKDSLSVNWQRPLNIYGADFVDYEEWIHYKSYLTNGNVSPNVIALLEDDFLRLRWSDDDILEIGGGPNANSRFAEPGDRNMETCVPFMPIWIDEQRVREAHWRSVRRDQPMIEPEGWTLDADLLYRSLRDGSFFKRKNREVLDVSEWGARLYVQDAIMHGKPGEYPGDEYWKREMATSEQNKPVKNRSNWECSACKSRIETQSSPQARYRLSPGRSAVTQHQSSPPLRPHDQQILGLLKRADEKLYTLRSEAESPSEDSYRYRRVGSRRESGQSQPLHLYGTPNPRGNVLRTSNLPFSSSDHDLQTVSRRPLGGLSGDRSPSAGQWTWRDV